MATLTAEQSARLLEAVRHSHIYWPVLIALATGARREVLAIRWRNVDLDRGTIRIVESLVRADQIGLAVQIAENGSRPRRHTPELRGRGIVPTETGASREPSHARGAADRRYSGLRPPRRRAITAAELDARISALPRQT